MSSQARNALAAAKVHAANATERLAAVASEAELADLNPRRRLPADAIELDRRRQIERYQAFVAELGEVYRRHGLALAVDYDAAADHLGDRARSLRYQHGLGAELGAEDVEDAAPIRVVALKDLPLNDHAGARLCLMSDNTVSYE